MAGERPRFRSPTGVVALAVAVLGLLGLVALGARGLPGAPGRAAEPVGIRVDLTTVASTALTVVFVLLVVFLVWLFWPDGTESWEPPPRRTSVLATLAGLLLLLVGLYLGRSALVPSEADSPPAVEAPGERGEEGSSPLGPGSALPAVLALAGAALAAAAVRSLVRRRDGAAPPAPDTGSGPVAPGTVAATGGEPAWPRDARRQVIRAYDEMEALLAAAGTARDPWEAPREYLARIERRAAPWGPETARLTDLFEVARFSRRPVDTTMGDAARAALGRLERVVAHDAATGDRP